MKFWMKSCVMYSITMSKRLESACCRVGSQFPVCIHVEKCIIARIPALSHPLARRSCNWGVTSFNFQDNGSFGSYQLGRAPIRCFSKDNQPYVARLIRFYSHAWTDNVRFPWSGSNRQTIRFRTNILWAVKRCWTYRVLRFD